MINSATMHRLKHIALLVCVLAIAAPTAAEEGHFIRGDANGDHQLNLADAYVILSALYLGESHPCHDAIDVDDNEFLDLADPISLLTHVFLGADAPADPYPDCGPDPDGMTIECLSDTDGCGLGGPIDGLTVDELEAFFRGRELMSKQFTPSEGLGPFYNTTSCAGCHDKPVVGGSAAVYRNFVLARIGTAGSGQYHREDLPSAVMPSYNGFDGPRPTIPEAPYGDDEDPVRHAWRNAPPMFGVGLFEFISNDTIRDNADPNDSDDDGISGRYNRDAELNLGRFGYKAQANFIEAFIRGAAQNQMGMTTNPVEGSEAVVNMMLLQVGSAFDEETTDDDDIDDPEISFDDFEDIIAFNRFLRPPRKKTFSKDAEDGETLFDDIGCTDCHIPTLESSKGDVHAYTDLLLHEMGDELADDIHMGRPQPSTIEGSTTVNEFRTQPLWGVSMSAPYLHDGRAESLHQAIELHGGEAEAARDEYLDLTETEQEQVLEFLRAL